MISLQRSFFVSNCPKIDVYSKYQFPVAVRSENLCEMSQPVLSEQLLCCFGRPFADELIEVGVGQTIASFLEPLAAP